MTTATKRKSKPSDTFERRYQSGLIEHVRRPSEATLGEAYELGRSAIAEGKSLLELASVHHLAIQEIVNAAAEAQAQKETLNAGASFLMESLSPFEMSHRGFQDAVKSLRHLNETLEEEIKRIAYEMKERLLVNDVDGVCGLLRESWAAKKRMAQAISNSPSRSRAWLLARKCSRRSSIHFTGRPMCFAANGMRKSSG